MHYQRLKTFLCVYENLSFKKAAELLIMTQSAVSQQIAALEKSYDSMLFKRKGRIIEPTAEGKALYDWTVPVVAAVEGFPDRFRALKNLEHGKLNIGSTEDASLTIAPFLARFCAAYSMIQVSFKTDMEESLKQSALEGTHDFIVVDEVLDLRRDPSFKYQACNESGFVLIVPPSDTYRNMSAKDILASTTFLMHVQDVSLNSFVNRFFSIVRSVPYRILEIGNIGAIKKMVQEGAGVSILGEISVSAELEAGLVASKEVEELRALKRKTLLLFPANREIVYSAWAFRRMFENEKKEASRIDRQDLATDRGKNLPKKPVESGDLWNVNYQYGKN